MPSRAGSDPLLSLEHAMRTQFLGNIGVDRDRPARACILAFGPLPPMAPTPLSLVGDISDTPYPVELSAGISRSRPL